MNDDQHDQVLFARFGTSSPCWRLSSDSNALELTPEQTCYCGDDLPDLRVMGRVGLAIAVANAHGWVRERAHWRTRQPGGDGAVREVCDLLIAAQGNAETELARFL